ncbi:MAG: ATP-binding protein [Promethearchaeota archaeon]
MKTEESDARLKKHNTNNEEQKQLSEELKKLKQELAELKAKEAQYEQIEKARRNEQKMFETVIQNIGVGFAIVSEEHRILWANENLKQMFGESKGKFCYELFQSDDICPNCALQELLDTNKNRITKEAAAQDIEGRKIWLKTITTAMRDEKGKITSIIKLYVPITERKQAEEDLQKLTEKLHMRGKELNFLYTVSQLITEASDLMKVVFEETLEIIPAAWQFPEITCARILLKQWEFRTEKFETSPWKLTADIRAFNQKVGEVQVYYLEERPTIDEGPFLKEERALIDALARELGKFVERKESEAQQTQLMKEIESVNAELRDFAYIVSHDLKAPLRAIESLITWLSEDYEDMLGVEGKELLDLLLSRVNRLNNLIKGILQYSRIGRIKEEKVSVDVTAIVNEVTSMLNPPNHIKIEIEQLPIILCEKTRIKQVFQNLIENAIKFMDKRLGKIVVGCIDMNEYWKFYVADNGPGIEKKYFDKIFQVFQTLAPRDEVESTGIGLALVKKIVEMYDGRVWVESEVDKGSTFFFTLPKDH